MVRKRNRTSWINHKSLGSGFLSAANADNQYRNSWFGDAQSLRAVESLVRLPELTQVASLETVSEEEWSAVATALSQAINQLKDFRPPRRRKPLLKKFLNNIDSIEALMKSIEPFEKSRVEKIRTRLEERIAELPNLDLR